MRKAVVAALYTLHAMPVENSVRSGTPDIAYIGGWLELKWIREYPKREDTTIRLHHFTKQQRIWLKRHWQLGGNAFLLLQIKREWFLFEALYAYEWVGLVPVAELRKNAVWHSTTGFKPNEFRRILEKYNENCF